MEYNRNRHELLRLAAHKCGLAPEEYDEFVSKVRAGGSDTITVTIPDWPPIEYPPLQIGGGNPFEGKYVTGAELAVDRHASAHVRWIAREMAGDRLSAKRLAYQWQISIYDPEIHVLIRQWLADRDIDIVAFYREYLPAITKELGRTPVIRVANPHAAAERDSHGSWSPRRRAVLVQDLEILERFAGITEKFTYNLNQSVSWIRALDGSRWEARRQYLPQSNTWGTHRSYIQRTLGQGAWTEADRDNEGNAHGPWMELWNDGTLHVWIAKRALPHVDGSDMTINGVPVRLEAESGVYTWRMAGQVSRDHMGQILGNAQQPDPQTGPESDHTTEVAVEKWVSKLPFMWSDKMPQDPFHRTDGQPLVVRLRDGSAEIRIWGDPILASGITLNGVTVRNFRQWQGGWRATVTSGEAARIIGTQMPEPRPAPPKPAPEPAITGAITDGSKTYSPTAVMAALRGILGDIRFFGRSPSDSAFVALTRRGIDMYLAENDADRMQYVTDAGGRNYDCENFAEQLRCGLQTKYGVNGVGIIWGDGHAWNFFIVATGTDTPEILMVEPQTDAVVDGLAGQYAISRRCEILL